MKRIEPTRARADISDRRFGLAASIELERVDFQWLTRK